MVSAAMAYVNLKQYDKAEALLRRALAAEPENAAANFNLGLLLAETDHLDEAEKALRTALKADPQLAAAAYNLGVILRREEGLGRRGPMVPQGPRSAARRAEVHAEPGRLFAGQGRQGRSDLALEAGDQRRPQYLDGYEMLAEMYESEGQPKAAARALRDALQQPGFPPQERAKWEARAERLEGK